MKRTVVNRTKPITPVLLWERSASTGTPADRVVARSSSMKGFHLIADLMQFPSSSVFLRNAAPERERRVLYLRLARVCGTLAYLVAGISQPLSA